MLVAVKPIGPAEAEGWGTGEGFAIHPAILVGRAAGAGWNGCQQCMDWIMLLEI